MLLGFLKALRSRLFGGHRTEAAAQLELGIASHKNSQFADAERHYRGVLHKQPRHAEATWLLGVACHQQNRLDDALRYCARAVMLAPGNAAWLASVQSIANRIGRDQGVAACEAWVAGARDLAAYIGLGNALREAGRIAESETAYRRALALEPDTPIAASRLGSLLALQGRLDEADACFSLSARAGFSPDAVLRLSDGFFAGLGRESGRTSAPHMRGEWGETNREFVVFICGDPAYFRNFAGALIASLLRHGGSRFAIHLHIINPDAWVAEEFDLIRDRIRDQIRDGQDRTRIIFTTEPAALPADDSAQTYYACARLLHLPALLARYQRPLLMLDMDMLVLGDLDRIFAAVRGAEFSLIRRHQANADPWEIFSASVIFATPGVQGTRLAGLLAAYVRHFLDAGLRPWGLDQAALFAVLARVGSPDIDQIHYLPADIAVSYESSSSGGSSAGDALFWNAAFHTPSNRIALCERPFTDYLPALKKIRGWYLPGIDYLFAHALADCPLVDGRPMWEADLMRSVASHLRSKRRALDIGAHIGFWSFWLAQNFRAVEAFEPLPLLRQCFAANVTAGNTRLHACALGEREGTIDMQLVPGNTGMSHVLGAAPGGIPMRRLDEFDFDEVDFIKIDAEGFESFILRGGEQTLLRNRPLILMEEFAANPRYGVAAGAAVRYLLSLGAVLIATLPDDNHLLGWLEA